MPQPGHRIGRDGWIELRICHSDVVPACQTKSRTTFGYGHYGVYAYGQLMAGGALRPIWRESDGGASCSRHVLLMTRSRTVVWVSLRPRCRNCPRSCSDMDQARSGLDSCGLGFVTMVKLLSPPRPSVRIDVKMRDKFSDDSNLIGAKSIGASPGDSSSAEASSTVPHE